MSERSFKRDLRRPVLEGMIPCYILDPLFRIIDWNPALHEILAKPKKLHLGMSATKLLDLLDNEKECRDRVMKVFGVGKIPLIDHEPIIITIEKYGQIHFHKIATQIIGDNGQCQAWVVGLNIRECPKFDLLVSDIMKRIETEVLWEIFAQSLQQFVPLIPEWERALSSFYQTAADKSSLVLGMVTAHGPSQAFSKRAPSEFVVYEFNQAIIERMKSSLSAPWLQLIKEEVTEINLEREMNFDLCLSAFGMHKSATALSIYEQVAQSIKSGGKMKLMGFAPNLNWEKLLGPALAQKSQSADALLDCAQRLSSHWQKIGLEDTEAKLKKWGLKIEGKKSHLQGQIWELEASK